MDGPNLAGVAASAMQGAMTTPSPHATSAKDAAQQFEALLLSQMLHSERESGNGWLGTGSDSGDDCAIDFAEQQLATMMARQGGLGLASMIASDLKARS